MQITFLSLITSAPLNYCCEWMFFHKNKRTGMIAERLGIDRSTVKRHKAKFRAGEMACTHADCCLKSRLG
jgi:hypothetical protein